MAFITNTSGQPSSILFPISATSLPSATAVQIGILPKGSVITSITYEVATADAATVSVGTSGSAAAFATATALTAGLLTPAPTGTQIGQWLTVSNNGEIAVYAKASTAITTGVGAILVTYRYEAV